MSVGAQSKEINVTVHNSSFDSDFSFDKDGIVSGNWIMADNSIIGERASGNGFILSSKTGDDFTFTGQFSILSGAAASLVFRASNDMSKYLVANYDANDHIVKLWSTNGELARSGEINVNLSNITLSIRALERNIDVKVNGVNAINNFHLPDSEPLSGRFGLNVFSGKAEFKSLDLIKENYDYSSGDLVVVINSGAFVKSITNMTMGNTLVYSDFYYQEDDKLHIKQSYFDLLENGMYRFSITATNYSFIIKVDVHKSASAPAIEDVTVQEGYDVTIYIGTLAVSSLKINGQAVPASAYHVSNYTLVVDKSYFSVGDNTVLINGSVSFKVSVLKQQSTPDGEEEPDDDGDDSGETTPEDNTKKVTGFKAFLKSIGGVWVFVAMIAGAVVILGGVVVLVIFLIKRKKSAKGEQKPEKSKKEKKDKKDE